MTFEIQISSEYDGTRPRTFLKKKLDVSFFQIPKLIKNKRVTLNGKRIKKEDVLKSGDVIKVWEENIKLRETKKNFKEKKDLGLRVIYENNDFIIFNKVSGVIVQGAQDHLTSLSLHLAYYKDKIGDKSDFEYFHTHRLDKETSGVLVVAKNMKTLRELNRVFRMREITKKYLTLVVGEPKKNEGLIDVFLCRNPEGSREKMRVCKEGEINGKRSISKYRVIKKYEHKGNKFSLIEVEIKTGVTHQIRVHMKYIGTPVLGDKMYGNSIINREYENLLNRQFLHAEYLKIPFLGKEYEFKAELTEDLKKFLRLLKIE